MRWERNGGEETREAGEGEESKDGQNRGLFCLFRYRARKNLDIHPQRMQSAAAVTAIGRAWVTQYQCLMLINPQYIHTI